MSRASRTFQRLPMLLSVTTAVLALGSATAWANLAERTFDTAPVGAPVFLSYPARVVERVPSVRKGRVTYPQPKAHDSAGVAVTVTCTPPSGSVLPLGTKTVTCRATSATGATSKLHFVLLVASRQRPPAVTRLNLRATGHATTVSWKVPRHPPLAAVKVWRAPGVHGAKLSLVYHGLGSSYHDRRVRPGVSYTYSVRTIDALGRQSPPVRAKDPPWPLIAPAEGAQLFGPPLLYWAPAPHASYYNVQLYVRGKEVFSAWPGGNRLRLRASWTFDGHRHTLSPGNYVWYVWPGHGPRAAARYGHVLGRATFAIVAGSHSHARHTR